MASFNQTWHIKYKNTWVKRIRFFLNKGPGLAFIQGEIINEIVKIHWRNYKIFSRTTGPISTKLGTKHHLVMGIQDCSDGSVKPISKGNLYRKGKILKSYTSEPLDQFQLIFDRGDNFEIAKIHWPNLKIFFSRHIGPILTTLDEVFMNKDHSILKKEIMSGFFSLYQFNHWHSQMCFLI